MWIDDLYSDSERLMRELDADYVRTMYGQVKWDARMMCLMGARGVGKTTMLLQRLRELSQGGAKALYVTLDDLCFTSHRLVELVDYHYLHGGTHLLLDEAHRYPSANWALELKNIYDKYPRMHVAFSGSSVLEINSKQADLSRRCMFYSVPTLSFREYLEMEGAGHLDALALPDLLGRHVDVARDVAGRVKVIEQFERFLRKGSYPFYRDENTDYGMALRQMVSTVIETDLPAAYKLEHATLLKLKQLMNIIAHTVPFVVNVQNLADNLGSTRKTVIRMLDLLAQAQLINLLYEGKTKLQQMAKPEKVYLANANLMYALSPSEVNVGTLREAFFADQVGSGHALAYSGSGDFVVDDRYTVEVGGRRKSFNQIKDLPNSLLAIDGVEVGQENKVPLWMFGFLR